MAIILHFIFTELKIILFNPIPHASFSIASTANDKPL